MSTGRLVVAVTGASGAIYAQRFLRFVAPHYNEIYLMLSRQAKQVAETELDLKIQTDPLDTSTWLGQNYSNIILCDDKNYYTPPASGSFRHDGMVIVPCSMGTIGRIANGVSDSLVTRAADVCLKERRKLIVVPREMPWNLIMLRNLTTITEVGGIVLPASPAWYHNPRSLEDLADTVVSRILQQLDLTTDNAKEWMIDHE